jgi:hypothetical protein
MTGYSVVMPLAPRIVRACRATSNAMRTLLSLPTLTWRGSSSPDSLSCAMRHASSCAFCSSSIMSTSFCWVSWNAAIGLPYCTRVLAYSSAAW